MTAHRLLLNDRTWVLAALLAGVSLVLPTVAASRGQEAFPTAPDVPAVARPEADTPPTAPVPPDKPVDLPAAKPAEPAADKPAEAPAEKPVAAPADAPTVATQPPAATPGSPDPGPRLDAIEKQLGEITKLLQGLRPAAPSVGEGKPTAEPATPAAEPAKPAGWSGVISPEWLAGIRWRSIGPANMSGRIVDLAVNEADPNTFWAATASGGLIKTTNAGVSFSHQFDREATVSIGAVAVARGNPDIVWVGTGENNPRNSVSYGDGVYKSTDGGKTWKNMGLKGTYQIGEIVIHPTNPDTVYVGALGRLYGDNGERGVFKTTDGGATWERCFFVDERTGVIDMQMHPTDPETLIVAAWERLRDGFDSWPGSDVPLREGYGGYDPIRKWGPGSGLHKTTDGGKTWRKLTKGLPTSALGRIGIDWYRKDPNVVFAVVDCEAIGKGPAPLPVAWGAVGENRDGKALVTQVYPKSPAARAGLLPGDVVEALGDTPVTDFDQILDVLRTKKPGDTFAASIARGAEKRSFEFTLAPRPGSGGRSNVWLGAGGEEGDEGLKVGQIAPDSPAAKAGLQADDLIVEFDGTKAESWEEVAEAVGGRNAGERVKVKLVRAGETRQIDVVLAERSGGRGRETPQESRTYVGITGQNAAGGGAKITAVTENGPAAKAGVLKDDVVRKVQGKPAADYRAMIAALRELKAGDTVRLEIARATEVKEIDVVVENRPEPPRPYTASLGGQAANVQDQQGAKGFEYGGIYKSTDGGESWSRINSVHSRPMYFSVIRVDPSDDKRLYLLGVAQYASSDGGLSFQPRLGRGVHADGHALWIDPRDGRHMVIGVDGGVYVTFDRGARWDHLNTLALGQFYHVAIAPTHPYAVYGGLQDNGTWGGPALSLAGSGLVNEDWLSVGGGDGFRCQVDPTDPELVYWTSQDGNMGRRHMKTGERASIRAQAPEGEPAYRFNWNTPFILSAANSRIFYAAGNYVFRSLDRGARLEKISPEITLTKRGSATALAESPRDPGVLYVGTDDGALWATRDGGREWTEIGRNLDLPAPRWVATIEASRFADGRVYVCLDGHRSDDDDPYVMVSEDYGKSWKSLRGNLPRGSTRCLRESPFNEKVLLVGTEFALFASADRGGHWNTLNTNLPTVAVHEVAFHPTNGDVVVATHGRSLWIADIGPLHQFAAGHLSESPVLYKPATAIRWQRTPSRGTTNRRFVGENPPAGASLFYALPAKAQEVNLEIKDAGGATLRELRGNTDAGLHRVTWDLFIAPPGRGGERGTGDRPAAERGPGGRGGRGERPGEPGPAGQPPTRPDPATRSETTGASPAAEAPASSAGESGAAEPEAAGEAAGREGGERRPRGGRGPGDGGSGRVRVAPSGTYRVVLTVDGKEYAHELRLVSDPNLPIVTDLAGAEEAYDVWTGDDEPADSEEEEEQEEEEERARAAAALGGADG